MKNVRVIIGAGKTEQNGWISTQQDQLNMLDKSSFYRMFGKECAVDAFLAEHVFEHLSPEEAGNAAHNLYTFLKHGGYARIAVPDVNFRNEWYHNMCKSGGQGSADHPAATHKVFYDYKTLSDVFSKNGFEVDLLEYCDESGYFHFNYWNPKHGKINRSLRFDTRNDSGVLGMISLIIDARKL